MKRLSFTLAIVWAVTALAPLPAADAATFEANKCVSSKLKEAGKTCKGLLKAWSKWDKTQDAVKRDAAILKTTTKFAEKWDKIDGKALAKGTDCADTTISLAGAQALIDAAVAAIVADVNGGLTLTPAGSDDGKCGAKLLGETTKKCDGLIKNFSKYIKAPGKDPSKVKLDAANLKVTDKFEGKFDSALAACPNSTATTAGVELLIDGLRDDMVANTTISPNVSDTEFDIFTFAAHADPNIQETVEYEGRTHSPSCLSAPLADPDNFDDFSFFVKRGENGNENKVFVHLEGGGACWDFNSCYLAGTTDPDVQVYGECNSNICENGSAASNGNACVDETDCIGNDNANQLLDPGAPGFFDFSDPNNPWHDWTIVWVPTCAGDVFSGDAADQSYSGGIPNSIRAARHRGFQNAKVAEKFVREHFLDPDELVVTGLSAGSAGLPLHQYFYNLAYPAAEKTVIYDSFVLVVTQVFLDTVFANWDALKNFPAGITLQGPTNEAAHIFSANLFPDTNYAHVTNAFDGPNGQGGFYHVMKNLNNILVWASWWDSICEWNGHLTDQLAATSAGVANDNYRYYVSSGSVHGTFPTDRAYTSTLGGVPTLVSWVNDLLDRTDPLPANVEASPSNVLVDPGDPQPSPFGCPFEMSGPDVVINCTDCTP